MGYWESFSLIIQSQQNHSNFLCLTYRTHYSLDVLPSLYVEVLLGQKNSFVHQVLSTNQYLFFHLKESYFLLTCIYFGNLLYANFDQYYCRLKRMDRTYYNIFFVFLLIVIELYLNKYFYYSNLFYLKNFGWKIPKKIEIVHRFAV